jgi:5'-nucleotidase / UDP-sugar diphosphatase
VATEQSSFPDAGTTIADERTSAAACVKALEDNGVNKIVMLTHIGYGRDIDWMAKIPGVDVVIGGHSHTLLGGEEFSKFDVATPSGSYATIVDGVCVINST